MNVKYSVLQIRNKCSLIKIKKFINIRLNNLIVGEKNVIYYISYVKYKILTK
jgi:hypothetical protein